ncbi:hypothetical protein GQX74_001488 [Glossina fuscipes]|nr:hypothetical protein GQX74_001488 [Glossina fuscipes]
MFTVYFGLSASKRRRNSSLSSHLIGDDSTPPFHSVHFTGFTDQVENGMINAILKHLYGKDLLNHWEYLKCTSGCSALAMLEYSQMVELTRLGSAWHVANTTIIAPYKAFSREKLPARIGTHIGLMHVNVTLTDLSITEMFTCHQAIINANNSKNDGTTRTTAVIITATLPGFQFVFTYLLLQLPKSVFVEFANCKKKKQTFQVKWFSHDNDDDDSATVSYLCTFFKRSV